MHANTKITKLSALNQAIQASGGITALAKVLQLKSHAVINQWRRTQVPAERCPAIEQATGGLVRCEDLRPDVAWHVVRGAADVQAAIKHVEAVAVAEIKHVAEELLKEAEPWDGVSERRTAEQPWDGVTERRKLNAPLNRRVSPESVARAAFLRSQAEAGAAGKVA